MGMTKPARLRVLFPMAGGLVLAFLFSHIAHTQQDELADLGRRFVELRTAGEFGPAAAVAERGAGLSKARVGEDHPDHAKWLDHLAGAYKKLNRFAEAEPHFKRALAIREAALGDRHSDTAESRNSLALFYRDRGRHDEAEQLLKQSLAIYNHAPDVAPGVVAFTHDILGGLYKIRGRFGDAEPLYLRALAIREKAFGADDPETAKCRGYLGLFYRDQGRYSEAEPLIKDALASYEKVDKPDDSTIVETLDILTGLYRLQRRYDEAEPHLKRALAIRQRTQPNHTDTAKALTNLALLYRDQGRYDQAEPLLKDGLAIREKTLGPENLELVDTLNVLAGLNRLRRRPGDAEPHASRALAIREKHQGQENPDTAKSRSNLALVYQDLGRFDEAERLFRSAIATRQKTLGPKHSGLAETVDMLAALYQGQGRFADAEPLLKQSIAIREEALGPDHPSTADSFHNIAGLYSSSKDWQQALAFYRKSIDIRIGRRARGLRSARAEAQRLGSAEVSQYRDRFADYVRVAHRVAAETPELALELHAKAYEAAQWALITDAAGALAQMSARFSSGDDALARLVREHQDLANEWRAKDGRLVARLSEPSEKRVASEEQVLRSRLDDITARIAEIDKNFAESFPGYTALANPEAMSIADTQALLRGDEALVLFVDTPAWKGAPEETFVWAVTKTGSRWARSDLGTDALTREVAALRCGLDRDAWFPGPRCADLTGRVYTEIDYAKNNPLPFDLARAHRLYEALFGQIEDLITGKHLLVAPSGPLTQLPFQVLVTEAPDPKWSEAEAYPLAAWAPRRHAITVLPAVASLKALRSDAKGSKATKPFIGFGNPLLNGPDDRYAGRARAALDKQHCPATMWEQVAAIAGLRQATGSPGRQGGLLDREVILGYEPLPETADELCAVARDLGVTEDELRLGARATEAEVKGLSAKEALASYRVIHFATHGAKAGELHAEPGLVLTPPAKATEAEDGYLTASEIAELKLDADWVILSACNTAAGAGENSEALSGLARAFLYSGARALLVSHWAVYSQATVTLITTALGAMAADPSVGRAEALRRAGLALVAKGGRDAHPAYWAPFVVVGEGAHTK